MTMREAVEKAGMTCSSLAAAVGVPTSLASSWIRGKMRINEKYLESIATALNLSNRQISSIRHDTMIRYWMRRNSRRNLRQ